MLKAEMTIEQLEQINLFTTKLIESGWNDKGWKLIFESGQSLNPETFAEYQNAFFNLRVSYFVEKNYVLLEIVGRDHPIVLNLRLYVKENLDIIVDTLIAIQNTLSPDNYSDFVKTMIPLCDLLLIETSEGLIQASLP